MDDYPVEEINCSMMINWLMEICRDRKEYENCAWIHQRSAKFS